MVTIVIWMCGNISERIVRALMRGKGSGSRWKFRTDLIKVWKSHLNCKTNLRYTHNETALYYCHVIAFNSDLHVQPNRCFDYFTGQLNILRATRAVTVWIIYLVFHVFSAISVPEIDDPLAPKKDLAKRYVFLVFLWHVSYSLFGMVWDFDI